MPLVGRDVDIAALRERIVDPRLRLVTVTGPVGVGKSRIGVAVFDDIVGEFSDGGYFLDLRDAADADAVRDALATAFGVGAVRASGVPSVDDLVAMVGDREFLLAIDHGECVTDVISQTVAALIGGCPRLRVLVLSGEPLRIYGEWLFRLAPLEVPGDIHVAHASELERVPSVRLLIDRALAVREGFALTPDNQAAIIQLCARLDGLPLAIELAAARMKLFTARAILAEVERGLDILQASPAGTSSRHRAMRDAIAFGCERLRLEERTLFARLAVFSGGFTIAAARLVAGELAGSVIELLEALVDKSLLVLHEQLDGELSFVMLGTTRAYAMELLECDGGLEGARRGHADHFFGVATRSITAPAVGAPEEQRQERWLRRLSMCQDDVYAALDFLVEGGDADRAAALAVALRSYWLARALPRDGLGWLDRVLAMRGLSRRTVADLLLAKGELAAWSEDAGCDVDEVLDRAAGIYETSEDRCGVAACERVLGVFHLLRGDQERAEKTLTESIDTFTAAGDQLGVAHASLNLAMLMCETQRYEVGEKLLDGALEIYRAAEDTRGMALVGLLTVGIYGSNGDDDGAERICREVIRDLDELGERLHLVPAVEVLATLLIRHHRSTACWRKATLLLAAAAGMRDDAGHRSGRGLAFKVAALLEQARDRLGDETYDEIWAAGNAMSVQAMVVEALTPVSTEPPATLSRRLDASIPLTARELEVAELVSAGLTNRQVARRLGIAEWTVVNHLRKIMRKLDCSSRVEVARWLTRQRVVEGGAVG